MSRPNRGPFRGVPNSKIGIEQNRLFAKPFHLERSIQTGKMRGKSAKG
jgi:hypothetical protein